MAQAVASASGAARRVLQSAPHAALRRRVNAVAVRAHPAIPATRQQSVHRGAGKALSLGIKQHAVAVAVIPSLRNRAALGNVTLRRPGGFPRGPHAG